MKPWRMIVITVMAFAAACSGVHAEDYEARVFKDADGKSLPYRLLMPQNYDAKQKYPLVVFFHGAGERGDDNERQLVHCAHTFSKPENRSKYPCFVVVPQCPANEQWVSVPWGDEKEVQPPEPSTPMRLSVELIAALQKQYRIDARRIYVSGLSMGGFAVWDILTRYPKLCAAGAPICGGGDETKAALIAKVPVWAFHSDDDTVVKVIRSRNMIKAMRDAGGQPKYTEYTGLGHFSWGQAYAEPDLLPWMFAQLCKD